MLRAGALPRRSRFALGHARARGLCPQSPDRLSRSAFVFADSSDARAKDALLCSTLTRPPAAFVAVSRQPPHAMAGGAATALVLRTARSSVASVLAARRPLSSGTGLAFAMPPDVSSTDRVATPQLLEWILSRRHQGKSPAEIVFIQPTLSGVDSSSRNLSTRPGSF